MNLDEIKSYYKAKLKEFGGSARGMDWKNEDTQLLRFEVISRYIDFSFDPAILDVGCGNAEFLHFCRSRGLACKYTGLDVTPEMVALANERFGPGTALYGALDEMDSANRYDYVIASGTFNARLTHTESEWREYFYGNVAAMFAHTNNAIVFNCMTEYVGYRYDRLYYPDLKVLADFAAHNLSRKFVIDQSYPLFELTMAIFK